MEIKFKGERKEHWLKDVIVFFIANILLSLLFKISGLELSLLQTLYVTTVISIAVYGIYSLIKFFVDNKFEFKWNKNK